jgi:hypothetical protein
MRGPCPVEPSCVPDDPTGAHQTNRAVGLRCDKKLIALAEVKPLADLSRKDDPPPVSKSHANRLSVDHA